MKRILCGLLIIVLITLLASCAHKHEWRDATCTAPMICDVCGETSGTPLGHKWLMATCTEAKTCERCGNTEGAPLGHSWEDATCTKPKTCVVCGLEEGKALEHDWIAATCTEPMTCAVCGTTQGDAMGHAVEEWQVIQAPACSEKGVQQGTCVVCGELLEEELPLLEHTPGEWEIVIAATDSGTGLRQRSCSGCGAPLDTEVYSLSEEEIRSCFIEASKSIAYDSLARTPDEYKGEKVKFSGYVVQVCSEASSDKYYSTYRVATSGKYKNVVYIRVDNYGSGVRILEDDYITFYGIYDGIYTYTTVMGSTLSIPQITVKYMG